MSVIPDSISICKRTFLFCRTMFLEPAAASHTYIHTYLLARPLGAFQSQMGKAQWIKTRPQHRELRALLFTISVWVL